MSLVFVLLAMAAVCGSLGFVLGAYGAATSTDFDFNAPLGCGMALCLACVAFTIVGAILWCIPHFSIIVS